jgi:energy-converting hydrogenase A subunit M
MRNVLLYIATTLNIPIVHYQTDNDEGILTRILEFSGVYELHPTRMDMQSQFIKDTHVSLSIANIHVPIGDNLFKELQQTFEKSKRRD